MATIVRLADYRRSKSVPRKQTSAASGTAGAPHYFCMRCDGDRFMAYCSGAIHCAHCGALMRNILVNEASEDRSGTTPTA
jgi:hypothetical protein